MRGYISLSLLVIIISLIQVSVVEAAKKCGKPPKGDDTIYPLEPNRKYKKGECAKYQCKCGYSLPTKDESFTDMYEHCCKGSKWKGDVPSCSPGMLDFYVKPDDPFNFLYYPNLPELTAFTFCFRYNYFPGPGYRDENTILWSYFIDTAEGETDTAMDIYWKEDDGEVVFRLIDDKAYIPKKAATSIPDVFKTLKKHCFTWESGGTFQWYRSEGQNGPLALEGTAAETLTGSAPGGTLVLQQYKFEFEYGNPGDITWFNMWDWKMSLEEINELDCESKGNVVSMCDLKEFGNAEVEENWYPCTE